MSPAAKARIVHGAIVALALWPVIHLGLVWRYDVSPWKLGGWGMYSTPRFGLIGMEIFGRASPDDSWQQLVAPSAEVRDAAGAFLERHRWLRRLASAEPLMALVLVQRPAWRQVRVEVSYPVLDRDSGTVQLTTDRRDRSAATPR